MGSGVSLWPPPGLCPKGTCFCFLESSSDSLLVFNVTVSFFSVIYMFLKNCEIFQACRKFQKTHTCAYCITFSTTVIYHGGFATFFFYAEKKPHCPSGGVTRGSSAGLPSPTPYPQGYSWPCKGLFPAWFVIIITAGLSQPTFLTTPDLQDVACQPLLNVGLSILPIFLGIQGSLQLSFLLIVL